ncbi:resistance protein [Musa troglodytarum]|uniref:Resistance protein n=1 Tax=Musa troglodytarum TaxID=320322 RepID=A0A9E7GE17_9LILI|nr:resistance protein [Musa troglodytarum]
MWLLVNERLGQRRYLLILNDVYHDDGEEGLLKGKWDELKHKLLRVGGMGSTVIITTKSASILSRSLDIHGCRDYLLAGLSEEAWIKLVMREALIGSEQDNTCSINFLLQFAEQQYETLESSPLVAKTLGSAFRNTEVRRWQQVADALSSYSAVTGHPHFELMSLQILPTKPARLQLYRSLCGFGRFDDLTEDCVHMMNAEDLMPQQSFDVDVENIQGYLKHLREIKLVNLRKCERLPPLGQLLGLETIEISGMDSITTVHDAFYGDGDSGGDNNNDGDGDSDDDHDDDGGTFPRLKSLIFSEMPMLERWLKPKGEGDMFPELSRLMLIQCPKFKELHVRLPSTTSWSLFTLSLWLNNDKLLSSEFVGWQNLEGVGWLEISGCEELRCLPPGIKHLESLEWLEISRCNNLIALPDWLAQLKSLGDLVVRDCARLSFIPERLKQSPRLYITIKGCPRLEL